MTSLDRIKSEIQRLFRTNPNIHVNVSIVNPKVTRKNEAVVITGVYPHIFQIEERRDELSQRYTLQYTDVLLGQIEIVELEEKDISGANKKR